MVTQDKKNSPTESRASKLLKNLGYFAIGGMITRLIAIFLVPFYARTLGPASYGEIELITSTVGLLFPIISFSLYEGVLRFTMSKTHSSSGIFTTALLMVTGGLVLGTVIFYHLAWVFPGIEDFSLYIILLLVLQVYRSVLSQYCRAEGKVKSFVNGGILEASVTAVVAIIGLYVFNLGIYGYISGLAIGQAVAIIFFAWRIHVWNIVRWNLVSKSLTRTLIVFCFPLMINGALWWVVNSVNRLFIAEFSDVSEVGIFGVAQKVASLLAAALIIFNQAWQMSANEEHESETFKKYAGSVFDGFHFLTLFSCISLSAIVVPLTVPVFGEGFVGAGPLIPFLLLSAALSGSASFMGTFHMAKMKTRSILWSSLIASGVVVGANVLLVPRFEALGAALAAVIGFSTLVAVRLISLRKILSWSSIFKLGIGIILVIIICMLTLNDMSSFSFWTAHIFSMVSLIVLYRASARTSLLLLQSKLIANRG